jgi:hypothetical protein
MVISIVPCAQRELVFEISASLRAKVHIELERSPTSQRRIVVGHPEWPFIGTEALAAGAVNRYQLGTQYDAVFRNVYVPKGQKLSAVDKAVAAWLWSGRRATAAGLSAAALNGSLWIDARLPSELNQPSRHKTTGILLHSDVLFDDESAVVTGIPATTPDVRRSTSAVGGA